MKGPQGEGATSERAANEDGRRRTLIPESEWHFPFKLILT